MPHRGSLQSECLSLVSGLYAALGDGAKYAERRAACEAWIFTRRGKSEAMTGFLRHQLARAAEARQVARASGADEVGRFAAIAVDDSGAVLAAGPEAWDLLKSGDPASAPLHLPAALRTHLEDMSSAGAGPARALRVRLDSGAGDVAAVMLGVDDMPRRGRAVRVATLLIWELRSDPVVQVPSVPSTEPGSPDSPPSTRARARLDAGIDRRRRVASDE
jgi:hypothetical protein